MKAIEKLKLEFPERENPDSIGGAQGSNIIMGIWSSPIIARLKKGVTFLASITCATSAGIERF